MAITRDPKPPGEGLRRALLLLGSLALALTVAELSVRLFVRSDPTFEHRMHRIPHPTRGWVLEPGADYRYQIPETTVDVRYSTSGLRDLEHTVEKPPGTYRVLVLGDSYMEGYSVDLEDSFSRRLSALWEPSRESLEVINMGVGGYGTLQSYLAFVEAGIGYSPDLVLLGFHALNDVQENSLELRPSSGDGSLKVLARPFLDPSESEWTITQVDYAGAVRRFNAALSGDASGGGGPENRLALVRLARLALPRFLGTEGTVLGPEPAGAPGATGPVTDVPRHEYALHACSEPPEISRAWAVTRRILTRLDRDVRSAGAELVVFTVPSWPEVVPEEAHQSTRHASRPDIFCLEEAPGYTRLEQIATAQGLRVVDLLPEFRRAARGEGVELYHGSDWHWNADGHALAARLVFEGLCQLRPNDRVTSGAESLEEACTDSRRPEP